MSVCLYVCLFAVLHRSRDICNLPSQPIQRTCSCKIGCPHTQNIQLQQQIHDQKHTQTRKANICPGLEAADPSEAGGDLRPVDGGDAVCMKAHAAECSEKFFWYCLILCTGWPSLPFLLADGRRYAYSGRWPMQTLSRPSLEIQHTMLRTRDRIIQSIASRYNYASMRGTHTHLRWSHRLPQWPLPRALPTALSGALPRALPGALPGARPGALLGCDSDMPMHMLCPWSC